MISLMGFFEEDVGPDTISDLTTTVIMDDLAAITEPSARRRGCRFSKPTPPLNIAPAVRGIVRPQGPDRASTSKTLCASCRSPTIGRISSAQRWRMRASATELNQLLGGIIRPTVVDRKHALRSAALESPRGVRLLPGRREGECQQLRSQPGCARVLPAEGIIADRFPGLKQASPYDLKLGPNEIMRVVRDTVEQFKRHVEAGNLWEELWVGRQTEERTRLTTHLLRDRRRIL